MRCLLYCFTFVFVSVCVAEVGHRCIIDELENNTDPLPIAILSEGEEEPSLKAYAASDEQWNPIRIRFFTHNMDVETRYCTASGQQRSDFRGKTLTCEEGDVFTAAKRSIVLHHILPAAIQMHTERLLVKPILKKIKIPKASPLSPCSFFIFLPEHHSEGVSGADTFLYVAAAPIEGTTNSWAVACSQIGTNGRPFHGTMNFGPRFIDKSRQVIRITAHEIAHALGFTFRCLVIARLMTGLQELRGKARVVFVQGPKIAEKVKLHYNCSDLIGMEMEDEGGTNTARSHLESRNAKDELMAPNPIGGFYTALSMAIFEDLGYYRGQWGKEEPMMWGNASGCSFLNEACVTKGVTKFPDMFCTSYTSELQCTSDRLGLGTCSLYEYNETVPPIYQYFANPRLSGEKETLSDQCPVIMPTSNTMCFNGDAHSLKGSRLSPISRCVKGYSLQFGGDPIGDICADISCENKQVSIRLFGDDTWHLCPHGNFIKPKFPFTKGKIICPSYDEVCPDLLEDRLLLESSSDKTVESGSSTSENNATMSNENRSNDSPRDKTIIFFYIKNVLSFLFFFLAVLVY